MGPKEQIREDRNRYLPNFKAHYDDYLQYAPAATVYGLKLAGVKGETILEELPSLMPQVLQLWQF